jgi:hypothetical protein
MANRNDLTPYDAIEIVSGAMEKALKILERRIDRAETSIADSNRHTAKAISTLLRDLGGPEDTTAPAATGKPDKVPAAPATGDKAPAASGKPPVEGATDPDKSAVKGDDDKPAKDKATSAAPQRRHRFL